MTIEHFGVIPNCRYGHGDLTKLVVHISNSSVPARFGIPVSGSSSLMFAGQVYTCQKCGYTEFFDDAPSETAAVIGKTIEAPKL